MSKIVSRFSYEHIENAGHECQQLSVLLARPSCFWHSYCVVTLQSVFSFLGKHSSIRIFIGMGYSECASILQKLRYLFAFYSRKVV